MNFRFIFKKYTALLSVVLVFCLGTQPAAVQAATAYEMYELIEETPSESGYIPAYDPAEELAGERILEEDTESQTQDHSDAKISSPEITIESDRNVFDDGTDPDHPSGFDDGSSDLFSEDETAIFSEDPNEPENLNPDAEYNSSVFASDDSQTDSGIILADSGLPVRYSLADAGCTTSVKNQKNLGICWAFSSLESIETGLIKKGLANSSISLSETHLAYCAFHGTTSDSSDPTSNETFQQINNIRWTRLGGNRYYSIATLSRGYGPAYDSSYPLSLAFDADTRDSGFDTSSILDSIITDSAKKTSVSRLKNCYWLFEPNSVTGTARTNRINDIKKFIMNYGAVEIGIYTNSYAAPYDAETNSFYSPDTITPNHSVTLIGWDDEKETAASAPGAFLLQNSWGSSVGEGGLFWVSYQDRSIKAPSFYEMEEASLGSANGEIIHQYDGTGYGSVIKPANPSDSLRISGANVFTADTAQYIKEVSFYAAAAPISYTISIYRYVKSSPDTGVLVHTQNGNTSYAGYFTVDLTEAVPVAKGEKFAVQLQFNHNNGYVPHEKVSYRTYDVQTGQSFLYNGTTWTDMTDLNYNCNICIKAIGIPTDDPITIAPQKPVIQSAAETNYTKITAEVSAASDKPDGYDFVLGTSSSFLKTKTYKQVIKNNTSRTAVFSSLAKGTYYIAAHAYRLDSSGNKVFSSWSDPVKITVSVGLPSKRKVSAASVVNGNQIKVSVASSTSRVSGYDFALGKTSAFTKSAQYYKTLKNITKTSASFTYIPKGTYYAAVRAYNLTPDNKKVYGSWSDTVKVKITGTTPGTPAIQTVTTGKGTLKAAYSKASGAYQYQYVLTTKSFSAATYIPTSRYKLYFSRPYGTISLKGLKSGTYYLGVRAYSLSGSTRIYGKWSVRKVTIQ